MNNQDISIMSLIFSSSLVMIALVFSYWQRLGLEKDLVISVIRAVVQLVAVGYVLDYVFGMDSWIFTSLLLLFMIANAAYNAKKRGKQMGASFRVSFLAIGLGTAITIAILVLSKTLEYKVQVMVPVGGMIISNSMVALGLCYKSMASEFRSRYEEVQAKLGLGADILPSSINLIRDSIKTGIQPTVDSAKTLGVVALPGMMTGLILAGTSPLSAIKYQIMVTFMLISTTSISSFIACYLSYKNFFNNRKQLVLSVEED